MYLFIPNHRIQYLPHDSSPVKVDQPDTKWINWRPRLRHLNHQVHRTKVTVGCSLPFQSFYNLEESRPYDVSRPRPMVT